MAEVIHSGEIVTVTIDNVKIGTRMWPPYQFPVAQMLTEGRHVVSVDITDAMAPDSRRKTPRLVLS